MEEKERVYLYLARRDRSAVKLLTVFRPMEKKISPSRVSDIADLKLPTDLERSLSKTIYDERMYWEPWIQSAANYNVLRDSLRKRRFKNVPLVPDPLHPIGIIRKTEPRTAELPKRKVMLKKKKD